jgi:hypothetical protein
MNRIMKNRLINKAIVFLCYLIAGFLFPSCSDWAETEPLTVIDPNIKEQNPELYAKYLVGLQQYKASAHKFVYVWFDNSLKSPVSRAHRINALPDSIDVVALMYPDGLVEREREEMRELKEKATKVIYSIDFEKIKAAYNAKMELALEGEPVALDFKDFCIDSLAYALSLVKKYDYDGVCIGYSGKAMNHMDGKEKKEYKENEKLFIGIVKDWCRRNPDKHIVFEGKPQHLVDKSLLAGCQLILIPCQSATNEDFFTYHFLLAADEDIPLDRLGVIVSAPALNDPNKIIGYLGNGDLAMQGLAHWAQASHEGIRVAGVGIYNVSTDYYNATRIYNYTRELISSINPSLK